jgi:hypothetical protein
MKIAVFWVVAPCSTRLHGATTQKTAIFRLVNDHDEFVRIRKKAAVACFNVLSRFLRSKTEQNHENFSQNRL